MATKTYGEMFEDIVDQVGFTNTFNDGKTETKRIKRDINNIQKKVLSISKTYLKKSGINVSGGTVAGQASYDIPSTVDKVSSVKVSTSSWDYFPKRISQGQYDELMNVTSTSDTASFWLVSKGKLYLYPAPATSGNTIELNANQKATDLNTDPSATTDQTTNLEIKEGYEDTIYYYCLYMAYRRLEDRGLANDFKQDYLDMLEEYKNEVKNPTNSIVVGGKKLRAVNPNYYTTFTN